MSKCITIDDTIDKKEICTELATQDIVEFILEEILHSAVILSDKGCSRIGDFNITEDFCQQFDQQIPLPYKEFEKTIPSETKPSIIFDSGEKVNVSEFCTESLQPPKDNLKLIIGNLNKKEEKIKNVSECKVITPEILADNELQIKNGQIFLESNKQESLNKINIEAARQEYFEKEDVIKDEKIEIKYFNEGKVNKIYVPLGGSSSKALTNITPDKVTTDQNEPEIKAKDKAEEERRNQTIVFEEKSTARPFVPLITEEFRQSYLQIWGSANSSIVGDMSAQPEEVVRLMEELSSVQVYPDTTVDPNRPRACAFGEEDVKKMTREIEEINFNQNHTTIADADLTFYPDGQGDADLESKSFTKETTVKSSKYQKDREESISKNNFSPEHMNANKSFGEINAKEVFNSSANGESPNECTNNELTSEPFENHTVQVSESQNQQISNVEKENENDNKNEIENENKVEADKELPLSNTIEVEEKLSECKEDGFNKVLDKNEESALRGNVSISNSLKEMLDRFKGSILSDDVNMSVSSSTFDAKRDSKTQNESKGNFVTESGSLITQDNMGKSIEDNVTGTLSYTKTSMNAQSDYRKPEICLREFKFDTEKDDVYGDGNNIRSSKSDNCTIQEPQIDLSRVTQGNNSTGKFKFESEEKYDSFISDSSYARERGTSFCSKQVSERSEGTFEGFQKFSNDFNGSEKITNKEVEEEECKNEEPPDKNKSEAPKTEEVPASVSTTTTTLSDSKETEDPAPVTEKFKLHSQKMYSRVDYEPPTQGTNELILTKSEENLIDTMENIIQIINPLDSSVDEDSAKISFSLLDEQRKVCENEETPIVIPCEPNTSSAPDPEPENNTENREEDEETEIKKKPLSGMTTIGPLKNLDYDPKDLRGPDIDYGKMTKITSSRQLASDIYASEVTSTSPVKVITEDDSDDETTVTINGERVELTSLVNRDIASLTKVQKVREVMMYHPKPEKEFEDEESLTRPRLDLKDVESMTDERYKVPEVNIPLLSFEVGDNDSEPDKEFIQSMNLVLSGNCYANQSLYDSPEETPLRTQRSSIINDPNKLSVPENNVYKIKSFISLSKDNLESTNKKSITFTESANEQAVTSNNDIEGETRSDETKKISVDSLSGSKEGIATQQKYGTLGNVFKKASNKFIRKENDLYLRGSKSLPRDTSKITTSESIKSILDDCQSSASNVLKKSRSLLKNTQSIFKTISQNRFHIHDSNDHLEKEKSSPSESEINNVERKLSSFLRKEDFTKAKNLIKSKVEKTFKMDSVSSPRSEPEMSSEKKDRRVALRNEENFRVERMENFKKLLTKNPLVYKSQFVKSQGSFENKSSDDIEGLKRTENQENISMLAENDMDIPLFKKRTAEEVSDQDMDKELNLDNESKLLWSERQEISVEKPKIQIEVNQPEFIVMETVPGLPNSDAESYLYEMHKFKSAANNELIKEKIIKESTEGNKSEAAPPLVIKKEVINDYEVSPRFNDKEEKKNFEKKSVEKKSRTKTKKFTARFRSFWSSTFGKVKASPTNTEQT